MPRIRRAAAAYAMKGEADPAGELGQPGDVLVAIVDRLEGVARAVEEVATAQLRMGRAGVEEGGRGREVIQRGDQAVELDRLVGRRRQPAGDAHEPVLGGLDDEAALGMAQQVAVVHRTQPEVLEEIVARRVDRFVELVRVVGDEGGGVVGDQPGLVAGGDRLRERVDVLIGDLLVDERGEEAGGEPAVVGLLADQGGRGADAQLVEIHRRGPVVQPADRARGDPHQVDPVETARQHDRRRARSC